MNRTASLIVLAALVAGNVLTGHPLFQVGLAAFALVFAVSLLLCLPARGSLVVRAEVQDVALDGGAACRVLLRNGSAFPLANVRGILKLENHFTDQQVKRTVRATLLPHGESVIGLSTDDRHPGKATVTFDQVRVCDLFGIVALPVNVHDSCSFTLVPAVRDLDANVALAESESFDNGDYSPYRKGRDISEVFQMREYEPGDSPSQIHWKLSGKMGKLFVKEGSLPLDRRLVVVADKSCGAPVGLDQADAFAELVVSLGADLVEKGLAFRMVHNNVRDFRVYETEISSEDDFAEAVPQVLSSPIALAAETCMDLYGRMEGVLDASHVLCVCCRPEEDYAGAFGQADVVFLDARMADYERRYATIEWDG